MNEVRNFHPESKEAIGHRLKCLRLAVSSDRGFDSAAAFCRSIDISPQAWNQYEGGSKRIELDNAKKLVREHGVPLDWIYFGSTHFLPAHIAEKIRRLPPDQDDGSDGRTRANRRRRHSAKA